MRIWLFLYLPWLFSATAEWIDPFSMDSDNIVKKKPILNAKLKAKHVNQSADPPTVSDDKPCTSDIHYRRLITFLLSQANLKESSSELLTGIIYLKLDVDDYNFLKSESNDYHRISAIFDKAFQKTMSEEFFELTLTIQERLFMFIFNYYTITLTATTVSLYFVYVLVRANFRWNSIGKLLLFFIYVFDFAIRYMEIVKEEDIDNMVKIKEAGGVMPECDPARMRWSQYLSTKFQATFTEHPCKTFYQATYSNNMFIAPTKVFPRQFKDIIVQPLEYLGEGFGKYGNKLFYNLPLAVSVFVYPLMLIMTLAVIMLLLIFATGTGFKINIFPSMSFELGSRENNTRIIENSKTKLDPQIEHRRVIEIIEDRPAKAGKPRFRTKSIKSSQNTAKLGKNDQE